LVEVAQSLEAVIGEEYKRDVDSVSMRFGKRKDMEFSIGKLFFFFKGKNVNKLVNFGQTR
jgi:hypothetical protein